MRPYCITTDSNSDLPKHYINKYKTTIIPQYFCFNGTAYGDTIQMSTEEFYIRMRKGELPTSEPNRPEIIEGRFTNILNQGIDIIHIAFSSALSESCNNVKIVANELMKKYPGSRITVIDSLNVSLAESIMVIRANELKERGMSYDDVVKELESLKSYINVKFIVDDLFHLQRGGRVSKTIAIVGSVLNLKPSIYVSDTGELSTSDNIIGRKKAIRSLCDCVINSIHRDMDYTIPIGIMHANCLKEAEALAEMIKENTRFETIIINDISPSIGVHAGPGTLAIAYYGNKKPKKK